MRPKRCFDISCAFLTAAFIAVTLISCSGGSKMDQQKVTLPSLRDVSAESWQKLSQRKIYFGHQSVGFDIISGIGDVMKDNPQIRLNIVETENPMDFGAPLFAHSPVGKNTDPKSKCDAFAKSMNDGLGEKAEVAFFKLCFVDIGSATDVKKVFEDYRNTIAAVKARHPKIVFVYVTAPLTTIQTGPKVWIKKKLGKPVGGYDDNIKREQFNEMIRKECAGREPLFDLARIESTLPDGSREAFEKDGVSYPYLVPAYSTDGGHLNEFGRRRMAEQMLIFLQGLKSP